MKLSEMNKVRLASLGFATLSTITFGVVWKLGGEKAAIIYAFFTFAYHQYLHNFRS